MQWKKYLKDHPDADKSNHKVVKTESQQKAPEQKGKKPSSVTFKEGNPFAGLGEKHGGDAVHDLMETKYSTDLSKAKAENILKKHGLTRDDIQGIRAESHKIAEKGIDVMYQALGPFDDTDEAKGWADKAKKTMYQWASSGDDHKKEVGKRMKEKYEKGRYDYSRGDRARTNCDSILSGLGKSA